MKLSKLLYSKLTKTIFQLHFLLFSSDCEMVGGVIILGVKSESNRDPAEGPTSYVVKMEHTPGARRTGGKGRKTEFIPDWSFTCSCPSYARSPTMCKHIGACLIVHFH